MIKVYLDEELSKTIPIEKLVSIEANDDDELLVFYTNNGKLECIIGDKIINSK